MLSQADFASLAEGELIEAGPFFPGLCEEPLVLKVDLIAKDHSVIEFKGTVFGVNVGRFGCALRDGRLRLVRGDRLMNSNELFELADALQMPLKAEGRVISGKGERSRRFGDLVVKTGMEVISGFGPFSGAAVIVRVKGDLGLLATAQSTSDAIAVQLAVLDLTRMPKGRVDVLETKKPSDMREAARLVEAAVVARFSRHGRKPWKKVTPPVAV